MLYNFTIVLAFLLAAVGMVGAGLAVGRFVRPRVPDPEKRTAYECGERPIGSGWFNFNPRFYVMALVFIVFDVEIALTYPVAAVARHWVMSGRGLVAVLEIGSFLLVLAAALGYVWAKGDLDWFRELAGLGGEQTPKTEK